MPEVIISASGPQHGLVINSDGSINVSGVDISIGSLALALENVYVTSGNVYMVDNLPTATNENNPSWSMAYDANGNVGSVYQMIGTGSYVNTLTWTGFSGTLPGIGSRVTSVSAWSVV